MISVLFPSPCGVNIVGNFLATSFLSVIGVVSVPLRGKYCREYSHSQAAQSCRLYSVSVPLRGKYCRESLWDMVFGW